MSSFERIAILAGACLAGSLWLTRASHAAPPPVDVEVVAEDEEDFFAKPQGDVKQDSDDAFEELSKEEKKARVRVKKSSSDGAQNVNTNVINLVVSPDQKVIGEAKPNAAAVAGATAEAKAEAAPVAPAPPAVPQAIPARPSIAAVSAPAQRPCATASWSCWWYREKSLDAGDILLSGVLGGGGENTGFGGLQAEALISDWAGLRLGGVLGVYAPHSARHRFGGRGFDGPSQPPEDFDLFSGSRTLGPDVSALGTVQGALLHLEELSFVMHIGGGDGGFDLFPSAGLAHFGYWVHGAEKDAQGGSGLARLGLGLGYYYHRFYAAFEVSWYPVELFRYRIDRTGPDQYAIQEEDAMGSAKRVNGSFALGMSL